MRLSRCVGMGIAGVMVLGVAQAGASVILLDVGQGTTTGTGSDGQVWNNLSDRSSSGDVVSLVYADGTSSGASADVTKSFNYFGNTDGNATAGYPDSATKDYYYAYYFKNGASWGGARDAKINFSGLDASGKTTYDFTLYGSGDSSYGVATFTLAGANTVSGSGDTGSNNSTPLTLSGVIPDATGNILLTLSTPSSSDLTTLGETAAKATLNFVRIDSVVPEPATLSLLGIGGLMLLARRRRRVEAA